MHKVNDDECCCRSPDDDDNQAEQEVLEEHLSRIVTREYFDLLCKYDMCAAALAKWHCNCLVHVALDVYAFAHIKNCKKNFHKNKISFLFRL